MLQACYCCWFKWRNSIACTHCNVISLEHNSIPQRAKSQRIELDATAFQILSELFTIIKQIKVSLNWIEKFGCLKPTKYGQFMFYKAVKEDMANSKETSFNNAISSTLSFITVLFEDLFEAVNIQAVLVGEKVDPKPSIKSPKKTQYM
jgi:hypothetical protein